VFPLRQAQFENEWSPLNDDVLVRNIEHTIQHAVDHLVQAQQPDGAWHEGFETGVMPDSHMAICLALLRVYMPAWAGGLIERLLSMQEPNGSWSLYPGHAGDLSSTVECYYALSLHNGEVLYPEAMRKAERFIVASGGITKCRNLTKVILAVGGEISWRELPSAWLYSFLFHRFSPVNIQDIVMFTRLHIAPIVILSAYRYVERPLLQQCLSRIRPLGTREKVRREPRGKPFRHRMFQNNIRHCVEFLVNHLEGDGTIGCYHSSTILYLFALRALGYSRDHPLLDRALTSIKSNFIKPALRKPGFQQTCDAHVWNTALAAKTMINAGISANAPAIREAINYLTSKQQLAFTGGWGFSSNNTKHPDNDDTVACLDAHASGGYENSSEWKIGIAYLLTMQNKDGGWAAFDRNLGKHWLEKLPANDMRLAMADPSTPDITGRVVDFIVRNAVLPIEDPRLQKALRWLRKQQEKDGSWFGRWGTAYLYGTWCAVKGLTTSRDRLAYANLRRAGKWLLKVQNPDGGFGECCSSDVDSRFVAYSSIPTHTAWGLDAMLSLYDWEQDPQERFRLAASCERAARWLLSRSRRGEWEEHTPTGSAFPGALYIRYHIYPKVWPLAALIHFRSSMM
jgi:sporulenol synthase